MIPTKITDHPAEALELFTERYKDKPVVTGFTSAIVKPMNELETAMWDVLEKRVLGNPGCVGVWLDAIGEIVGEKRQGRDDTGYEHAIRVRIRINRSKGRAIDVIDVALLLDATATYLEYAPLGWEVEIYGTPYGGDFSTLLAQAKAVTSYGVLITSTLGEASTFRWDFEGGTLGAGHEWESVYT